jgi:DNA-binding SARP family transcriptional activator
MSGTTESVRLELLGMMRAWRNGREVILGPPKRCAVLGPLARRLNNRVSLDELIDAVWGDDIPKSAANCVHTYVAGLRKALEPERDRREPGQILISTGSGYELHLEQENVDVEQFFRLHAQARRLSADGRPEAALVAFDQALALWRGRAYATIPGPFAEVERTHLEELRLTVIEERAVVMLALGRHTELAAVLSELVTREPLRERLRWLLMLTLYRCGRQAHALSIYRETRRLLSEELGIEPGIDLRNLHEQILAGGPDLIAPAPAGAPATGGRPLTVSMTAPEREAAAMPRPAQLPPSARGFVGRVREQRLLREVLDHERGDRDDTTNIAVIHGAAGVGKSALTLHVAHQYACRYPDGQLYLDLCAFDPDRDPLSAFSALAYLLRSLGVEEQKLPGDLAGRTALYRSLLHGRRILVVLDDASDPEQVRPLIPNGPACVLITSRRQQSGLVVRDGAHRISLAPLEPQESLELLGYLVGEERLAGRRAEAERLTELCGHFPLALRIMAEQLAADPDLPLDKQVERYGSGRGRLERLAVADDATDSMHSVFAASYFELPADAARMFRVLGRHESPLITLSTAAAMSGTTRGGAERLLEILVDNHLLEAVGQHRYRFPALIGVYAAECAQEEPRPMRSFTLHDYAV